MDTSISLLLPTRGRPALAQRFIDSAARESEHPERVEIVLYVDEDDKPSQGLDCDGVKIRRIIGPRATMGSYNMACLEQAAGDIIVLANDDVVIRTRGWDERLRELDARIGDKIYLAYPNDLFKGRKLCAFPILSRRACDLLGEPFPRAYRGAFIDYHLLDTFRRLEHAGNSRIFYLGEVVFEHMHFRTGKGEYDEIYRRRGRFDDDAVFLALRDQRSAWARWLRAAIDGKPKPGTELEAPVPVRLGGLMPSMWICARNLLPDGELPWRWRVFLLVWFAGRLLAARGYLAWLERRA